MTRLRLLFLLGVTLILLLLGVGVGAWWWLSGPNEIDSAELVPANTVAFASIPNAATVVEGYQTSKLKTLVDSPNSKPLRDFIMNLVGQKNADLIQALLPNLSGQSFIAVTHFDYDHPDKIGLIAGMKPKTGLGDFGAFVGKLKATWPELLKQGKTGTGSVAGVNYDWIQGPGAPDKICVARISGWIVTCWGETALQDWVERFQKKSTTSSLAQDLDYRKTLAAVGDNPMSLIFINNHALLEIIQKQVAKANPAVADYLAKKNALFGGAAVATRFENGEIVDHFSFLIPRPVQLESGMGIDPCQFETLKFTGPDTRFYWASSINWKQYYKHLKEQLGQSAYQTTTFNPMANGVVSFLQTWVRDTPGIDTRQNIIDALGTEFSVQAEWSADTTYPEVGLFLKLDKPDDFKPTITAIIESMRKAYATSAVIKEISSNGQTYNALEFVQSSPISPTITEDGHYLGVFLTENQAVRSFQRDPTIGLTHRAEFNLQVGDKRNGAAQVLFLDTPRLLDRGYQTAMPYLSLAGMFNKDLAAILKGKDLPADLTWLAPMGTWSCVITPDEEGIEGYSVSGVGNQGIFLASAVAGAATVMENLGLFPKPNAARGTPNPPVNPPPPISLGTPPPPAPTPTQNAPASYQTNAVAGTNTPPATNQLPPPVETLNDVPKVSSATAPSAVSATNSVPTNSVPVTNSNAAPPTPEPVKTQ